MSDLSGPGYDHYLRWQYETAADTPDAWDKWITEAERLFGRSLDGDGDIDGYCLDYAYDDFKRGQTPEQHVHSIQTR